MITPRRYMSRSYSREISGHIYGGDFRHDPELSSQLLRHIRWQSPMGYYLQLGAVLGWTSIGWLHRLRQPTLIMAGRDDPLVPPANARLMHALIADSELKMFDCGHLFLLTRAEQAAAQTRTFLDRPSIGRASIDTPSWRCGRMASATGYLLPRCRRTHSAEKTSGTHAARAPASGESRG
jgi:hypothetical protein